NRCAACDLLQGGQNGVAQNPENVRRRLRQFGELSPQTVPFHAHEPMPFDMQIPAVNPAEFLQPPNAGLGWLPFTSHHWPKQCNAAWLAGLLRACGPSANRRRDRESGDEFPSPHVRPELRRKLS